MFMDSPFGSKKSTWNVAMVVETLLAWKIIKNPPFCGVPLFAIWGMISSPLAITVDNGTEFVSRAPTRVVGLSGRE